MILRAVDYVARAILATALLMNCDASGVSTGLQLAVR